MTNMYECTMAERLGRIVLAGALAGALGAGAMALPAEAFADTGTFMVEAKDNGSVRYNVYKLFKADIEESTTTSSQDQLPADAYPGIATHIEWGSAASKTAILSFLDSRGYSDWLAENGQDESGARDLAQNAMAFIAQEIGASPDDGGAATVPATKAAKSFAIELAQALADALGDSSEVVSHVAANEQFEGEEGYYLFITDTSSIGEEGAGTSPIWVPLGGATKKLTEKTSIPSLEKLVKENSTGEFGRAADAHKGQDVDYRLVATLPDNIMTFKTYHLNFADTLSKGLEIQGGDTSSVSVKIGDVDVTSNITGKKGSMTYASNVLVVDIPDVFSLQEGLTIRGGDTVIVEYKAHLTDEAVIGVEGNQNNALLAYTNDPVTLADGTTIKPGKKTKTYTYRLSLNKVDKQTGESLAGAKYTVEDQDGGFVQLDGSLSSEPYEFVTDDDGNLVIPRIDAGVFTVREVKAPKGYELQDADIKIEIQAELDQQTGSLSNVSAQLSGGEAAPKGQIATQLISVDPQMGEVSIRTSDDKEVYVPMTGMEGTTFAVASAGGVMALSLAGLYVNRRLRRRDDEESE